MHDVAEGQRTRAARPIVVVLAALLAVVAAAPSSTTTDAPTARMLVTGTSGAIEQVVDGVAGVGGAVLQRLPVIDGVLAEVPADRVAPLESRPGVLGVTPDGSVTVSSAYEGFDPQAWPGSLPSITSLVGADDFWAAGHHGQGIDVAVVDTGISEVPGLDAGQVLHGPDLSFDSQDPATIHLDTYGHGTHLGGIIAGREADAALPDGDGDDGQQLTGLAPDARLVSVKIGDRNGVADVSQAIAAIDWVVQHRNRDGLNIRVLNLSFGYDSGQPYGVDPLAHAAETAWHNGIVVVAAAGNGGSRAHLSSPAYDPHIIAVGATDSMGTATTDDDVIPSWSSCDPIRNPDLVAPGRSVVSARVPVSFISHHFPQSRVTDTLTRGSGTSQSAAVVSGAAALVLSQRPWATPDQVRGLLVTTADKVRTNAPRPCQGNGVLDLAEARTTPAPAWYATYAPRSTGDGSLEKARGPYHVGDMTMSPTDPDAALTGEQDIFGMPWDGPAWATRATAGTSWNQGWWNGSQWTGSQWTGSQWTGSQWTGSQWTGSQWTGSQWTGSQWTGSQWTGSQWTGSQWTGSQWTASQWTSVPFYSATWD